MSGFRASTEHILNELEYSTEGVLDGACAGWDARVLIPEPGVDPFEGVDDDDLLHANAGVIAATVLAQSNQMRILDSGIVPDKDLVRPTSAPEGKFNEFDVYTPMTPPERYAVINEKGEEEVVTPTSPFYPGLAERAPGSQSAIQLKLEDETADPYRVALATGTALLQIGIEAGKEVGPVAEILNRAWGVEGAFSPGTVVGVAGTHEYSAIYAQDRNTNARRVASWQEVSYVRSGQLAMVTDDWGPNLHCDFRRARVAAESFFATSMAIETKGGGKRPTGKITYHVPSTSLLSANPAFLFFTDARPDLIAPQARCPAATKLLDKVDEVGLLRALWPSTEPVIADTWAATFHSAGGLARTEVAFEGHAMTAAPLYASSTTRLLHSVTSFARGQGKTVMTALSAKVAGMADNVVSIQTIGWFSRLAAVIEILHLCDRREARATMIKAAWSSLNSDISRDLERSLTNAQMAALRETLPTYLKSTLSARSSRIPVYAILWEVGTPNVAKHHTLLRGMRRGFARAREVAKAVTLREKVGWKAGGEKEWLDTRLAVLREFWALQFAALSQVQHIAKHLRSDLRWWVETSAAVNLFRAGVMRGIAVAREGESVATFAGTVPLRLLAYHTAAHLRTTLGAQFPFRIPKFQTSDIIADWATQVTWHTADYCQLQLTNIPRVAKKGSISAHTHHFTRGAMLLAEVGGLGQWVEETLDLVASDCETLLQQRETVLTTNVSQPGAEMNETMAQALAKAAEDMNAAMAEIAVAPSTGSQFDYIVDSVNEDAWEDFLVATMDEADEAHEMAKRQYELMKQCDDRTAAEAMIRWVHGVFLEDVEESGGAIV